MNPEATVELFGLQEGMKIADFGTGSGYFTILMAKKVGEGGQVAAVDILESALDSVRARAKSEGLNNINAVRSNLETVNGSGLENESQDAVLIKNVLFQSPQKEAIIKEADRVLRPGGTLIIVDWKKGGGGLGPPDGLRISPESVEQSVTSQGYLVENVLAIDSFHFGFVFRKKQ
jgi:ubiquinone/menaquinone biosynthesis C-methylase UbiE